MSGAEWIAIIGGICGIGGLGVAWKQLSKIAKNQEIATQTQEIAKEQLAKIAENQDIALQNQKVDILKVVLEIESQISQRSVEMNKAGIDYLSEQGNKIKKDYFLAMKENYFNALDRLCFCIRKGYIPEKEWEREYRNMIKSVIAKKEFKDDFDPNNSPYKNMIKLNDEWQDSIVK